MWSSHLPPTLTSVAEQKYEMFRENEHIGAPDLQNPEFIKTVCFSDYVADSLLYNPELWSALHASNLLHQSLHPMQFTQMLRDRLETVESSDELATQLRQHRRFHQCRIIWRDLNGLANLEETLSDLTSLADTCIQQSLQWHYDKLTQRYGKPIGKHSGEEQSLVILAMGKQGAGELNLSSDIDLIFAYPESGETQFPPDELSDEATTKTRKTKSNQEFFIKLGQALIQSLDKVTADGFVFRVDLRLRPYGESGPLVMNFSAMENYYHDQGRPWERYAMIKARAVTGAKHHQQELMSILRPFSYRSYVDFGAIESLREMKSMINREVMRRDLSNNVKLGSGGIREIEFIAQAFQLIRGGQDIQLQKPNIFGVMLYLAAEGYLPPSAVDELLAAYRFLRDTEHALQAIRDEQTQSLPDDDINQARVAWRMGFENWADFLLQLNEHRQQVSHHFAQVVAADDDDEADEDIALWESIWHGDCDTCEHPANLASTHELLDRLRTSRVVQNLQAIARTRLDKAMPRLLHLIWEKPAPQQTLERLLPLLESILRRSAYLVLLIENPQAMEQLVKLVEASPWIAQSIAQAPILLDELLHPTHLYQPNTKEEMQNELNVRLLRVPIEDLEEQMDALRHFAQAQRLQIAASDIAGVLPLMKVSDYLTWLAESVLEKVMWLAWHHMVAKYGHPTNEQHEPVFEPEFLILGYGKVGGLELSYGSDLDLVFLHSGAANRSTDGGRSLDNNVFYTRMGQRIIHILNTVTQAGQLYEIDMRLRPAGNSGLIVTTLNGFSKYQASDAWTWEHQALVRARVICGNVQLAAEYAQTRQQILSKPKDRSILQKEVREMRRKMRDNLGSQSVGKEEFQLKQDAGGIVDIEFMVQYLVLAYSSDYPTLLTFTDNIRILDSLNEAGILNEHDVEALKQAYIAYRSLAHRRALQNQKLLFAPSELDTAGLLPHIDTVTSLWQKTMNSQ